MHDLLASIDWLFFIRPCVVLLAILKDADLESITSKAVRMKLEKKFNCDLLLRKKEIDKMVMDYADSLQNEDSSSDDEEEQEEKPKPAKRQATKRKKATNDSDASSGNDSGDDYKPEKPERKAKAKPKKKKADGEKKTGRKGTGFTVKRFISTIRFRKRQLIKFCLSFQTKTAASVQIESTIGRFGWRRLFATPRGSQTCMGHNKWTEFIRSEK